VESLRSVVLFAARRDRYTELIAGNNLEDLFYRLNVLQVHLPPLREREGDVHYLLDHFLEQFTSALGKNIVGFTPAAMQSLLDYHFPGNIRELRNIVEYAVNLCKRKKISKEQLPPYLSDNQSTLKKTRLNESVQIQTENKGAKEFKQDNEKWVDIERKLIIDTLKKYGGNRTRTADSLGWGRMKLWRKMKTNGLLQ